MLKEQVSYEEGQKELEKFFSLLNVQGENKNKNMPRCFVDTVWHKKLENSKEYEEFCNNTVGSNVKHQKNSGFGEIEWFEEYEEKFGKLSPAWFANEKGEVDLEIFQKYIDTGDVKLEWDCNPIVTTP